MASSMFRILVLFCFIKFTTSKKGFVTEILEDKKFDCPLKDKKIYSVKSEIQCTHRCLQHEQCELLNYNIGKEEKDNCEIFTNLSKCSTRNGMKEWKAIRFKHQRKPKVYKSCKEIYNDDPSSATGVYDLETGKHFCYMESSSGSCGVGGWTLALKVDGTKTNFMVNSPHWTNEGVYNIENGIKSFYDEEAKFSAFDKVSFDDICFGMKVSADTRWLRFTGIEKNSLLSLFKDNTALYTTLDRSSWKGLMSSSSLQHNCRRQGFNVKDSSNALRIRIGYLANQENDCASCDSFIGIGPSGWSMSCGNYATGSTSPDNGAQNTKAMCYILIK